MMKVTEHNKIFHPILWFAVIWAALITFIYRPVVENPNNFLSTGGDGLKNYYTYMYHVRHDSTYWKFEGMNYPFGENIVFTDNQPILANIIKWLAVYFPELKCHLIGIHNFMLLIGLFIGGFGLLLAFKHMKLPWWYAGIATIGIMLINPQINRIAGHYGMFYPVLPWLLFIWLKIRSDKSIWWMSAIYGFLVIVAGLLHMYHFLVASVFSLLLICMLSIEKGSLWLIKKGSISFVLQVFLPFLILYSIANGEAYAADRPVTPLGFFFYRAFWEGYFFSYKLPLYHWINDNIHEIRQVDFEARNYLGLPAIIFITGSVFYWIYSFRKISCSHIKQSSFFTFGGVFLLSLLASMAFPFILPGLKGVLEFTGPLKQFRSIARLGWISFYLVNFMAFIWYYQVLSKCKSNTAGLILKIILPLILVIEALGFHHKTELPSLKYGPFLCGFDYTYLPVRKGEYQAILPNPYFSAGAESFGWYDMGNIVNFTYEIGYVFGIPTLGSNLSRTSFRQAYLLNGLVCKPYKVPEIIQILNAKDQRPLLVVESKLDYPDKRGSLNHWMSQAPVIYENHDIRLRRLALKDFAKISELYRMQTDVIDDKDIVNDTMNLQFKKSNQAYGYENYFEIGNLSRGTYSLVYWMKIPTARAANGVTEIWQYGLNHEQLDYVAEANQFNYEKLDNLKMKVNIPFEIKDSAVKLVVKVSLKEMKYYERMEIDHMKLRKR